MITPAILCLAQAVYYEARGEPIYGQLAVAQVVLNRKASPKWPNTVCEVVHQPYQFSFTLEMKDFSMPDTEAREAAIKVAYWVTEFGVKDFPFNHYYNPKHADPKWANKMHCGLRVGNHLFCYTTPTHNL